MPFVSWLPTRDSNPEPATLEDAALPIALVSNYLDFFDFGLMQSIFALLSAAHSLR